MHAIKPRKVRWSDVFNTTIVYDACCYRPGVHEIGEPVATVVVYLVVINSHGLKSFNTEVSSASSPSSTCIAGFSPVPG